VPVRLAWPVAFGSRRSRPAQTRYSAPMTYDELYAVGRRADAENKGTVFARLALEYHRAGDVRNARAYARRAVEASAAWTEWARAIGAIPPALPTTHAG
jgi:hypothetical protein